MKREYDFSKGERGKFYRPNVRLNLPIYLDDDISEFIEKCAKKKKVDAQTVVNEILMPTILKIKGHRFYFWSREDNEPPHIHVETAENAAKFWLRPTRTRLGGGI